jgi:hypothetical protein
MAIHLDKQSAKDLAALFVAFTLGPEGLGRSGSGRVVLSRHEAKAGRRLWNTPFLNGSSAAYPTDSTWVVRGRWGRWDFEGRFDRAGRVHDFRLDNRESARPRNK